MLTVNCLSSATTGRSSLRSIADVHRRLSANTRGRSRGRSLYEGGILAAPLAAEAQQGGKVYRIGYLSTPTRAPVVLRELTPITLHRHACSEVRNRRYFTPCWQRNPDATQDPEAICPY